MTPRATNYADGTLWNASKVDEVRNDYARRVQLHGVYTIYEEDGTYYGEHCQTSAVDYDGSNPATVIQDTLNAAAALDPAGCVVFKPDFYDLDEDITIPDPTGPGFTIDCMNAVLRPSSSYAGSGTFIQSSANTQTNMRIRNLRVTDPNLKLTTVMQCQRFQHCSLDNVYLHSENATVLLDFDGDHWNRIHCEQLIGGSATGLRLGNSNATNANHVVIRSAGGSGMTCVNLVNAGNSYVYVQDVSEASVGFSCAGSGNDLYARFEGSYGTGNNVVDPVKFTSASKDNRFHLLHGLADKVRHYITREGIGNRVVHPGVEQVFYDSFGGNGLQAKWLSTTGGTGAITQRNRYVELDTGGTTGGTARIDFNAKCIGYTTLGPWMDMYAQLSATTQETVQMQLRKDATNIMEFKIDPAGAADNWDAITTVGGVPTTTDTGITSTTDFTYFSILVFTEASKVQYYINGVLEATHTANVATWNLEPYFYIINKENASKKLYVWEVEIQQDQLRV